MVRARVLAIVAAAGLLGACDRPWSNPEKGAAVGAGLIGGAVGYLGGAAVDSSRR